MKLLPLAIGYLLARLGKAVGLDTLDVAALVVVVSYALVTVLRARGGECQEKR